MGKATESGEAIVGLKMSLETLRRKPFYILAELKDHLDKLPKGEVCNEARSGNQSPLKGKGLPLGLRYSITELQPYLYL